MCQTMFLNTLGYKSNSVLDSSQGCTTVFSKKGKHNSAGKLKWSGTDQEEAVKKHIMSYEPGITINGNVKTVILYIL